MEIKLYEHWMQPQVNKLFSLQYGRTEEEVAITMAQFYDHPFQKEKCIRIVSLDGEIVTGFQSLFYWPYEKDGKLYHSFQSGNSLVHPDYRGKGIFQKLLNYLDAYNKELQIDFLMGFPVQMSYGSFMKNKWSNPLNLVWYIKFLNPFAFMFSLDRVTSYFDQEPTAIQEAVPADTFRLVRDASFENWINSSRDQSSYCFFHFSEGDSLVRFALKANKRSNYFNELIIGDVRTNNHDAAFLKRAFSKLSKKAFTSFRITALTIAVNEHAPGGVYLSMKRSGFVRSKKSIYFITKSFNEQLQLGKKDSWELYRSDLDTW